MKIGMTHATLERNAAVGEMGKLKREMQQKEKDMEQVCVLTIDKVVMIVVLSFRQFPRLHFRRKNMLALRKYPLAESRPYVYLY